MRALDLTGQRFGTLTALRRDGHDWNGNRLWLCRCDCGRETSRTTSVLRAGLQSCGCMYVRPVSQPRHGLSASGTYHTWEGMIQRCTNPNNPAWPRYGGRGIVVCDRWRCSFDLFLADMGERPPGLTIERIDNERGYESTNCRWATYKEQAANRRPRSTAASRA